MAEASIIMHKTAGKLDRSVKAKAYTFLEKLREDDALPGLHIEPINHSADPKFRTGRVDQFWRAVLFKLAGSRGNSYVFYGVFPHDDSIALARKLKLDLNPVNGVAEISLVSAPSEEDVERALRADDAGTGSATKPTEVETSESEASAGGGSSVESSVAESSTIGRVEDGGSSSSAAGIGPAGDVPKGDDAGTRETPRRPGTTLLPGEKSPAEHLAVYAADQLTGRGIDAAYVGIARGAATVDELLDELAGAPEWQADVLLDLAVGTSLDEAFGKFSEAESDEDGVAASADEFDLPAFEDDVEDLDDETREVKVADKILEGLETAQAQLSFAKIEGNEELKRVIAGGDFAAWRVFLHPEQRRWKMRNYNGPFKLAGGAGTGKTVVLVHRAVRLAKEKPWASIVLTTFTVNLAKELVTQVRTLDPQVRIAERLGEPGIYIRGVDALVSDVLKAAAEGDSRSIRGSAMTSDMLAAAVSDVLGSPRTTVFNRTNAQRAWQEALSFVDALLPERAETPAFMEDEYNQIVLASQLVNESRYLRVRRPGRGLRMSRQQRSEVWQVIEQFRASEAAAGSVTWEEARWIASVLLSSRTQREATPGMSLEGRRNSYVVDHVLVDEGQDLTGGHWSFLRALVAPGRNDMFIGEDAHQRIYGTPVVLSHYGIETRGRSQKLTLNYRTTEAILRFGLGVLSGESFVDSAGEAESVAGYRSLRAGVAPVLSSFATVDEELDFVAERVGEWLAVATASTSSSSSDEPVLKPEQIAVLVRDEKNQGLVVRGLADRGVDVAAAKRESIPAGRPVVLTMHRAKGTEFRNVVLFNVGAGKIPAGLRAQRYSEEASELVDARERSLLYVAATRARDELVVTWHGEASEFVAVNVERSLEGY